MIQNTPIPPVTCMMSNREAFQIGEIHSNSLYCQEKSQIRRYGQKDPKSTEQAIFVCLLCECELKSVKTLRAHCSGSKHLKKELFFLQKRKDAKKD